MTIPYRPLSDMVKGILQAKFPRRASFDPLERLLYSHDLASPSPLLKPLIYRKPAAEGVVQPLDTEEVSFLVRLAREHCFPLTPRGRGTSGYGGAVPRYGGLVVDFSRMKRVLSIDGKARTATVEAGVVWADLEAAAAERGLGLRLYPSSAPSSTVGGWLAQGGSGFGSYRYGRFKENVLRAKGVCPDGAVSLWEGDELGAVQDGEGLCGLITEVSLKLEKAEKMEVLCVACASSSGLAGLLVSVARAGLPLWSVSFFNPPFMRCKERLRREPLPRYINDSYVAFFVYPASQKKAAVSLGALSRRCRGWVLPRETGERLWGERFEILKVKREAPSLISTKGLVPLEALHEALEGAGTFRTPFLLEGMLIGGENHDCQAALLGFLPHDERRFSYNICYGQALSFISLCRKLGGGACSTGMYFKGEAARILGKERLKELMERKGAADPGNILNPGKVLGRDGLDFFMQVAAWGEPLLSFLLRRLSFSPRKKMGCGRSSWEAFCCDQCGFCLEGCPAYDGWESRGQRGRFYTLRLLLQKKVSRVQAEKVVYPCGRCELCTAYCPQGLARARGERSLPESG